MVSIPACHAGDRGSIPRRGGIIFQIQSYLFSLQLQYFAQWKNKFLAQSLGLPKIKFYKNYKKLYNLISYCLLSFCVRKFFSSVTCLSTFPSQLSLTTYAESYRENKLVYPFFFCNQNLSNYFCFACLEQPQRKLLDFEKCVCLAVSRTCCVLKLTYYPSHE